MDEVFVPFPTHHQFCCLLSHLLMFLAAYIANNMDPDQTAPFSLIRVHIVCFHEQI